MYLKFILISYIEPVFQVLCHQSTSEQQGGRPGCQEKRGLAYSLDAARLKWNHFSSIESRALAKSQKE